MGRITLDDDTWTRGRGPIGFQIALATFGILALELALIRWATSQIRLFAYFNNLILIGAFLGMGLGLALGRRRPGLVHWTLPALAFVSVILAFAPELGLMRLKFPDPSIHLWGAEDDSQGNLLRFGLSLFSFLILFAQFVAIFLFAGAAVGHLFARLPPLRAYSWDLAGSLLGILALTAATFFHATPPVWLALGAAPFVWLSGRASSALAFVAIVALGWVSIDGALFSPYNRIDITPEGASLEIQVNRDFHQHIHDLSDRALAEAGPGVRDDVRTLRAAYDLPFILSDRRGRALIVGAGTGNDVMGALRHGYRDVISVDIDATIIDIGRRLHPERPYDDPRVTPVVNDARAFFEQYDGEPFDVVAYGLLDSHAMFASLSSLRLDNYVYTEEGIRAAWEHVAPGGHLTLSFSLFKTMDWMGERLYWTIAEATGVEPVMIFHGAYYGVTFVVARDPEMLDFSRAEGFGFPQPSTTRDQVRTTTDDWPFLYIRPGVFPWGYVIVLACVVLMAAVATPLAYGRGAMGSDFDPVLFLMGAAFLLIETRGVTSMSLLFGSTWLVNSSIFAGVIVMVLAANVAVERFRFTRAVPWFALLLAATALLWAIEPGRLNALGLGARGVVGGLVTALPIGLAGVIVSIRLARAANPAAALGSNLLGAVIGGCLEYFSMVVGLKTLALLALGLYLAALLWMMRERPREASPAA